MSVWTREIYLHLVVGHSFNAKGWFQDFLAALEAEAKFTPQTVEISGATQTDYSADMATRRARTASRNGEELIFQRSRKYKHLVAVQFLDLLGIHVICEFPKDSKRDADDCTAIGALGDRLAVAVGADFGTMQPITREAEHDAHDRVGMQYPSTAFKSGPLGLAARNWFGPRVRALAGDGALGSAGSAAILGNDILRIDLAEAPWTLDLEGLKGARDQIEPGVRATGILATPEGVNGAQPGPAWTSPDLGS